MTIMSIMIIRVVVVVGLQTAQNQTQENPKRTRNDLSSARGTREASWAPSAPEGGEYRGAVEWMKVAMRGLTRPWATGPANKEIIGKFHRNSIRIPLDGSSGRWSSGQGSRAQQCPKTAPRRLKTTPINGFKTAHDGPRRPQDGPQDGPKTAPRQPQGGPRPPKRPPKRPKTPPVRAKMSPRHPKTHQGRPRRHSRRAK